ncbi:DedA family protein [Paenibacillus puldeungensis]|uniref:DedA family protein n=1 Tax=Paenibacillus puldeungensis TaxID=696536 RepID=A0ABW3RYG2_9BACL
MKPYLDYLICHYGYVGLFGALALGIVGLPIPDETLLAYAGYSVYQGEMNFLLTIVVAFLGSMTGITLSYVIGFKLGYPFLKKFGPKSWTEEGKIDRIHQLFVKYGSTLLFFGYFIPGIRHLTAYVAGISNIGLRKFMLFAYLGALVWSATFISIGRELGNRWYIVKIFIHRYSAYLVIAGVIALIGYGAYRYIKKARANA